MALHLVPARRARPGHLRDRLHPGRRRDRPQRQPVHGRAGQVHLPPRAGRAPLRRLRADRRPLPHRPGPVASSSPSPCSRRYDARTSPPPSPSTRSPPRPSARSLGEILERSATGPDLVCLFVTAPHTGALEDIARAVDALLHPRVLVGATANAVVGGGRGVEDEPGLSLFAARLDGELTAVRLTADQTLDGWVVGGLDHAAAHRAATLLLLPDPFSFPVDAFLAELRQRPPPPGRARRHGLGRPGPGRQPPRARRRPRQPRRRRRPARRHRPSTAWCRRAAARSASR